MAWSFQIARVGGIPVRLHLTFLLLIGWIAFRGAGTGDFLPTVLALGLFLCVLLHEFGHALVARRFGVEVVDITLLPIGGLARMATIPRDWRQEFWIAVAGPVVSFALALLFHLAHLAFEPVRGTFELLRSSSMLLEQLASINSILAAFNLLPAFPMDGGRIFRALLASRMPYVRATRVASQVGQLLAFGLGFVGLITGNFWFVVIAFFVFMGAAEEGTRVQTEALIEGVPVREAAMTEFHTLRRADNVGHAADLLLAGTQQDFPVVEDGHVIGLLTRRRLLEALAVSGRDPYLSEVMEPAPEPVDPEAPLQEALQRMTSDGVSVLPVQTPAGLYGLLTTENSMEYLMVRAALRGSRDRAAAG